MDEKLYLCFVNFIGIDVNGNNIYELLFTKDKDTFWFENAEYKPLGLLNKNNISIDEYDLSKKLVTEIKLDLIQDSTCFGFQDCIDGCVCLCYQNIDGYSEYPEDGRLVFHYGEEYENVEKDLAIKGLLMED